MKNKLSEIRIVLLNTYHPGNIGAAARAMKTMGMNELFLVNPCAFPNDDATSRAAGAVELLEQATIVGSLENAIADCTQVFATSARQTHTFSRPQKSAEQAAQWIKKNNAEKVAIVFGGERDGMSAHELSLCQQILFVPGNPDYSILNVAAAVQIVCYELFKAVGQKNTVIVDSNQGMSVFATQQALNYFYSYLESELKNRHYIREEQNTDTLKKLRTFINRAQPSAKDIGLLQGMIKALSRGSSD
ncbi:RNA methyltransferase [Aliikangiella sp. IMCC44359]|uniref:RNA methyltransferase n=1 Tax=Aliikangiella sp. IMCC44359 TaxID=3459125 RepID=UPI00403AD59F